MSLARSLARSLAQPLARPLAGPLVAGGGGLIVTPERTYADLPGELCVVPTYFDPDAPEGEGNGSITAAHPSIVYFPEAAFPTGWNGYRYWMAHTPVIAGVSKHENPWIVASNDGETWVEPDDIANPVMPLLAGRDWQADVCLFYDPDDNKLHMWWLNIKPTENVYLDYSNSANGVDWSERVAIRTFPYATTRATSPALLKVGGVWHMWSMDKDSQLVHDTSPGLDPDATWTREVCTLAPHILVRHLEVQRFQGKYYMLAALRSDPTLVSVGIQSLVLAVSANGKDFSTIRDRITYGFDKWYKSAMVLHQDFVSRGAGVVGRMWGADANFKQVVVSDLVTDPASQLPDGIIEDSIDAAIANVAGYVVGDRFTSADKDPITGYVATNGAVWLSGGTNNLKVVGGELIGDASTSRFAALQSGSNDMEFGVRFSKLNWYLSAISIEVRGNRDTGATRLSVYKNDAAAGEGKGEYLLRSYVGTTTTDHQRWFMPNPGTADAPEGRLDGLEIVLRVVGRDFEVFFNGRRVGYLYMSEAMQAGLASNTRAGIFMRGLPADCAIDRVYLRAL